MHVRMKTNIAGPKLAAQAGELVQVSDADAEELIGGGYAEAVDAKGRVDADASRTIRATAARTRKSARAGARKAPTA